MHTKTIAELSKDLHEKKISSVELTKHFLERIKTHDEKLNSFVTVLSVFVLRWRQPQLPRPYRTFGYPVTPLLYLALTGWTLVFVLVTKPLEGLFGLGVVASGLVLYLVSAGASRASSTASGTQTPD